MTVLASISQLTIHRSCCFSSSPEVVTSGFASSACVADCSLARDLDGTHEPMPAVDHCQLAEFLLFSGGPIVAASRRFGGQGPLRSLASTDVKIILAGVLHTTCKLAVLAIQSLAVNAAKVESDVLYCASVADPCEMESLTVKAHIGHSCVSVGLLAVLHLRCTRDELNLDFSMLPWHSIGCNSMSSAARSSHSVVSIGTSDPSLPKDLSLPPQET